VSLGRLQTKQLSPTLVGPHCQTRLAAILADGVPLRASKVFADREAECGPSFQIRPVPTAALGRAMCAYLCRDVDALSCSYGAASRPSLAVADYWNPMRYNGTALEYGQGEPSRRSLPWDPVFVAGLAKNSGFFCESPYPSVDLVRSAFEA
jgi:hypothetical protein